MARVLFVVTSGLGHILPTIPLADAFSGRGHSVSYAVSRTGAQTVRALGYSVFDLPEVDDRISAGLSPGSELRHARLRHYISAAVDATPTLVRVLSKWRPDVIVRETAAFAGALAAQANSSPFVTIDIAPTPQPFQYQVEDMLDAARMQLGISPHGSTSQLGALQILPGPPRDWFHRSEVSRVGYRVQPPLDVTKRIGLPGGRPLQVPSPPTALISFGTSFAEAPFALEEIVGELSGYGMGVLVAGQKLKCDDHAARVVAEPFVHLPTALERVNLMVSHGGFGGVMAAVRAGIPQVIVPLANADGAANAWRVRRVGIGVSVAPGSHIATRVASAAAQVAGDRAFGRQASSLASALSELPPLSSAVDKILAVC